MKLYDLKGPIIMEVLLLICKNPGIPVRELIEKRGRSSTATSNAIKHLINIGLIKVEREEDFPRRKRLYPTEKGKKIGELLERIEAVLRD